MSPLSRSIPAVCIAAASLLGIGGCASSGAGHLASDAPSVDRDSGLDAVADAVTGEAVDLAPDNVLFADRVHVLADYIAASGRPCKQVAVQTPRGQQRVICRRADGHWTASRSLSRATKALTMPALSPEPTGRADNSRVVVPVVDELSSVIEADETLWGFSERVTGNGADWQEIARYNAIKHAAEVRAGTVLRVPPGLLAAR